MMNLVINVLVVHLIPSTIKLSNRGIFTQRAPLAFDTAREEMVKVK